MSNYAGVRWKKSKKKGIVYEAKLGACTLTVGRSIGDPNRFGWAVLNESTYYPGTTNTLTHGRADSVNEARSFAARAGAGRQACRKAR